MDPKITFQLLTLLAFVVALISAWFARRHSRAKNTRDIPEEHYNALVTDVDVLHPDDPPRDVPAAADNNIMRITEDYLFVRTASGSEHGGRASSSWFLTGATGTLLPLLLYIFKESFPFCVFVACFWYASIFWFFIIWRRQLPIIFNRKARTVTCWMGGKARTRNWDEVTAYAKEVTAVAQGGGSRQEGYLNIVVDHWFNPKTQKMQEVWVNIYGTEGGEFRGSRGAKAIWEYIRLYMDKGPGALPLLFSEKEEGEGEVDILNKYMLDHWSEAFTGWFCKSKKTFLVSLIGGVIDTFRTNGFFEGVLSLFFSVVVLLFTVLFLIPFGIPTDLFYTLLDRILPRRKWPKELLEACNYTWDGSNDHGPLSKPALKAFDFDAARKAYAASSKIRGKRGRPARKSVPENVTARPRRRISTPPP